MTTPGSPSALLASGGYVPPGVYIEQAPTPLVGTVGIPATLVAIVGPSVGYRTNSEQFAISTTPHRLAMQGILLSSVVVQRVDTGAVLTPSTDFTLTPTSSPSVNQNFWVDAVRTTGGALSSDTPVFLTYSYTDPAFYVPQRLSNFEDVKAAYGQPLNLTPPTLGQVGYQAINSPLALAAKIAFENGAGELMLCPTTPPPPSVTTASAISAAQRAALLTAYANIATNYDVNVVVPLTDGVIDADTAGLATELTGHLTATEAGGFYRVAVLGFDPGVGTAPDTLVNTGGFRSQRLMMNYASPSGMSYYNGGSNQYLQLGHQYLAAALGGQLSALPIQKALTKQVISSFSAIAGVSPTTSQKNSYAQAGVAVMETDRLGQIVVRHGLTTDNTSLPRREMSLVRARDALIILCETGIAQSGLIGTPISPTTTLLTVKSVVSGLLENAKITGTIADYTGLAVRQRSTDPSVVEVKFGYLPAYPLNYIVVSFAINVDTGILTNTTPTP